jgi:hypothetical protein
MAELTTPRRDAILPHKYVKDGQQLLSNVLSQFNSRQTKIDVSRLFVYVLI